jgi:hypothetical protein
MPVSSRTSRATPSARCLVEFEDSARRHPAVIVLALDGEDPPVLAEHDPGDADGVSRQIVH